MESDFGRCASCRRSFVPFERIYVEVGGVAETICQICLARLGGDDLGPAVYGRAERVVPAPPPPDPVAEQAPTPQQRRDAEFLNELRLKQAGGPPLVSPTLSRFGPTKQPLASDPLSFGVGLEVDEP